MKVSVLIPAFRPTFLRQSIASVLTQGFQDFEIIISDDCPDEGVFQVVSEFNDARISYSRNPSPGAVSNTKRLWNMAQNDLVKYLFDDDILLPNALRDLVDAIERQPDAAFAFGHRDWIDADGRVRAQPRLITEASILSLSRKQVSELLIARIHNRIGEFSNVLMNRAAGLSLDDAFQYAGFDLAMLVDVAFYLNATRRGPGIGLGRVVSHYRKHANQNSTAGFSAQFFRGFSEWELFIRGEYAEGHLSRTQAVEAVDKLDRAYGNWSTAAPELRVFREGLADLRNKIANDEPDVLDSAFRQRWELADTLAQTRTLTQPSTLDRLRREDARPSPSAATDGL